jgi:hypothetical protein
VELLGGKGVPLLGCLLNRADIRYYSSVHRESYLYAGFGRRPAPLPSASSASARA